MVANTARVTQTHRQETIKRGEKQEFSNVPKFNDSSGPKRDQRLQRG